MNIEKIKRCINYFEHEPMRLDMMNWITHLPQSHVSINPFAPSCGTVACLAGSAILLEVDGDYRKEREMLEALDVLKASLDLSQTPEFVVGARILDLTEEQASRLFYTFRWPEPFHEQFTDLHGEFYRYQTQSNLAVCRYIKRCMVRVLRARTHKFIETNGY